MKTILTLLVLALSFSLPAGAQEIDKMPMITVTGKAEIQVAPDEVVFSMDITKLDMNMETAKGQAEAAISKVRELTRKFGIPPGNVKISNISIEKKFVSIRDPKNRIFDEDGDEIGKMIFKGFEVSAGITVRLTEIPRFEDFFAESLKTGITEMDSVTFETSRLREYKDKARDLAMKAAKEKATAMAGSVGQTIGKAIKITEGTISNRNLNFAANNTVSISRSVSEPVATFAPGAIDVEAEVTVSFLLN